MRLTGFEVYRYSLPLSPPLDLKGAALRNREGLLVELRGEDGAAGLGETSPLPGFSRESLDDAAGDLARLAVSMAGREVTDGWVDAEDELSRELDRLALSPSARFGFELAAWNLYASSRGKTLDEVIAVRPRSSVPLSGLLSGAPEEMLEVARRMRDEGYEAVKLKVGRRPVREDVELARSLARELGAGVSLRLDANRAWSFEEASEFARGVADLPVAHVEEPLADPALLPLLAKTCGLPVALDESLVGVPPESLADHRYARAVVFKPTLLGGLSKTLRLARSASDLGMTPVVSSAYETGVGTAGLVALAASLGEREVPAGLDTYRRLAADVVHPRLELPAARADVRRITGLRRELDRPRLDAVAGVARR
jgi:O-succinylbenzoate synthase